MTHMVWYKGRALINSYLECGTRQGYGNTASSSVSSSPMDHESAGTDIESLKTSPVVPKTEQNEITGVLYKATGGRV